MTVNVCIITNSIKNVFCPYLFVKWKERIQIPGYEKWSESVFLGCKKRSNSDFLVMRNGATPRFWVMRNGATPHLGLWETERLRICGLCEMERLRIFGLQLLREFFSFSLFSPWFLSYMKNQIYRFAQWMPLYNICENRFWWQNPFNHLMT